MFQPPSDVQPSSSRGTIESLTAEKTRMSEVTQPLRQSADSENPSSFTVEENGDSRYPSRQSARLDNFSDSTVVDNCVSTNPLLRYSCSSDKSTLYDLVWMIMVTGSPIRLSLFVDSTDPSSPTCTMPSLETKLTLSSNNQF